MFGQVFRRGIFAAGTSAALLASRLPATADDTNGRRFAWPLLREPRQAQCSAAPRGPPVDNGDRKFVTRHGPLRILAGNTHPELAAAIAEKIGVKISASTVNQFKNGEIQVLLHQTMRGCDVFVIQPTCNPDPNKAILELLIILDAVRRGGAERITAVLPVYGYARQDKKDRSRAPITGKLVADLLEVAGANRVITIDLHASQIQGFVNYPFDNLYAMPLLEQYLRENIVSKCNIEDVVVVSPDAGAAKRAQYLATALGDVPLAIFSKQRIRPNEVAKMILVGEVTGKKCIIIDDMADTCGTLVLAAKELKAAGATEVIAVVTHGIFSSDALEKIMSSELSQVVVTDTIPMAENARKCSKLKVISVADLLARSIVGSHTDTSMEALFSWHAETGTWRPTLSA